MKYIKIIGISALIGILIGVVFALMINYVPKNYEEVITRSVIEDSDNLITLLNQQKYTEAGYLSESIGTDWWFLRNAYDTKFYDSVDDETRYSFWNIAWHLESFGNCTQTMTESYCQNIIKQMKSDIKFYQEQICPKSDLYNSEKIRKDYADFPEQMEEMLNRARC